MPSPSAWKKYSEQRHAPAPAKRDAVTMPGDPQKIWNDPDLLWRWTLDMLVETDSNQSYYDARLAPWVDQQLRRELEQLKHNEPLKFARRITRRPALAELVRKRRPGQPEGHQPGLDEAWSDVKSIREAWRHAFGHYYRSADPTAVEIAARFHGFTVDQLVNYTKNRNRKAKK